MEEVCLVWSENKSDIATLAISRAQASSESGERPLPGSERPRSPHNLQSCMDVDGEEVLPWRWGLDGDGAQAWEMAEDPPLGLDGG